MMETTFWNEINIGLSLCSMFACFVIGIWILADTLVHRRTAMKSSMQINVIAGLFFTAAGLAQLFVMTMWIARIRVGAETEWLAEHPLRTFVCVLPLVVLYWYGWRFLNDIAPRGMILSLPIVVLMVAGTHQFWIDPAMVHFYFFLENWLR